MTKSELISKLAKHYPQLTAKDAEFVANAILAAMTLSLRNKPRMAIELIQV